MANSRPELMSLLGAIPHPNAKLSIRPRPIHLLRQCESRWAAEPCAENAGQQALVGLRMARLSNLVTLYKVLGGGLDNVRYLSHI